MRCICDVSHFRVFGCDAHVHVAKKQRGKLDAKSQKIIFVGYNTVSKGYRLYDPERHEVIVSLDVVFDEQVATIVAIWYAYDTVRCDTVRCIYRTL